MFKPKALISGRLENSSGGAIRTHDLRVMSNAPESVLFVRRVLQISQTDERWFLLARHAAIVDRYSYSSFFKWVSQVSFRIRYYFVINESGLCSVHFIQRRIYRGIPTLSSEFQNKTCVLTSHKSYMVFISPYPFQNLSNL